MEPMRQGELNQTGDREPPTPFGNSGGTALGEERSAPLFAANEAEDLRSKWEKIQTNFVDEPRNAVKEADALVDTAIKRLSETFAGERGKLEHEWDRRDNVSTEDLRQAFRHYRAFFDRLLSV